MWIEKSGDQSVAHTLDGDRFHTDHTAHYSLCGAILDPDGSLGHPDMPRCPRCQEIWDEQHPRRSQRISNKKLARHRCRDCEDEHIIRPARVAS